MKKLYRLTAALIPLAALFACSAGPEQAEPTASAADALTATFSGGTSQFGITGTSPAVASRGSVLLDMMTINSPNLTFFRYDGIWEPGVTLSAPSGVTLTSVAMVANGQRLEVVAAGNNHKLYWKRSSSGTGAVTFGGWTQLTGASPNGQAAQLSIVLSGTFLHAFWVTTGGNIGHAWGDNNLTDGIESGDGTGPGYLKPLHASSFLSLDAVSSAEGRLDLVLNTLQAPTASALQHHWYDGANGFWGTGPNFHREILHGEDEGQSAPFETSPVSFVLTPTSGGFEVYTTDAVVGATSMYHSSYSNGSGWHLVAPGVVGFSKIVGTGNADQLLNDAITWSSSRHDVFGTGYQMYYGS